MPLKLTYAIIMAKYKFWHPQGAAAYPSRQSALVLLVGANLSNGL
jgi:hypothetical protein